MPHICVQLLRQQLRQALRNGSFRASTTPHTRALQGQEGLSGRWRAKGWSTLGKARSYSSQDASRVSRGMTPAEAERQLQREHKRLQRAQGPPPPQTADGAPGVREKGVAARLLIYHARVPRIAAVTMLNGVAIFIFGMATVVIAPAFYFSDNPKWTAPLIVLAGAMPLAFTRYTTRGFVNWIFLPLPKFAQHSREAALAYSRNLPPSATLHLGFTRWGLVNARAVVDVAHLRPTYSRTRLVRVKNIDMRKDFGPWWRREPTEWFVSPRSGTGKASRNVIPGVWESIYRQITSGEHTSTWRM